MVAYAAFALLTPDEGVAGLIIRAGIVVVGAALVGGVAVGRRRRRAMTTAAEAVS